MRRYTLRVMMAMVVVLCVGGVVAGKDILPLGEGWRLQSSAKVKATGEAISRAGFACDEWYGTSVPRTVLAALVDNKVYADPYYGEALKSIPGYREGRWLVMPEGSPFKVSWWYRREFSLPENYQGRHLVLHLEGINYRANVWLNGRRIADAETVRGMFRRFAFGIDGQAVHGGTNCLAVEIVPPGQLPDIRYPTKQIEATTGWDDHNPFPPDMNMGIWQDVYVRASGPVTLRHPYVATDLDLPSLAVANLSVSAQLTNTSDAAVTGELKGEIEKVVFSQKVALSAGETKTVRFSPEAFGQLKIANPRLWWPNPVGPQELYDAKLTFTVTGQVSDSETVRFGIREVSTYINEEGWRGYMVNGKKILIRGGAWMTSDMLLRLSDKRYEALIRYAKEANLNMLRSEGFSIRETDAFYSLCDRYGVMVTQQIFGRSIPDSDLAIACIEDMLLRIRNHPSLVHFLGHDETFPTEKLDKAYRDLIARYTPERTYQPHSGAFHVKDRFKTGGTRTGTRELWTYANPVQYYRGKQDGAWGFAQSGGIGGVISPYESMRRMMPTEALWPPWTETWSFHTVIQGGRYFDAMLRALEARYGKATGIEEFCRKGQVMNYESARGMFEAYGRNKYAATGITTWKYNAAWPASPTWQYIDWNLIAGGAYYGAKKACEPLHVQYSYDDHSVYVVNGLYRDFKDLKVTAKVYDFDLQERCDQTATVDVESDGKKKVFVLAWPSGLTQSHYLRLELADREGKRVSDNFYWLSTVPDVPGRKRETHNAFSIEPKSVADHTDLNKLPPMELTTSYRFTSEGEEGIAQVRVENKTDKLAFLVHLAVTKGKGGAEVSPTYWDENYFSLLPGEKREVRAVFAQEDLAGASPFVKVDGWNVKAEYAPREEAATPGRPGQ